MSNTIDLTWAKLPTFHHQHHEASNDGLIAFTSFLPREIFSCVKPYWEGYVFFNNKKTAIYKLEVIEALLKDTYILKLDGTLFEKSLQKCPGSLLVNKIINCSENSQNHIISKMSYKQRQMMIYTQIKKDLWALFQPSEVTFSNENFKAGEWTQVQPSKNDKEYDFNLSLGLLHYEEYKKDNTGVFSTVHRIAKLHNDEDLPTLIKYVMELKKYGKNVEQLADFDYASQWNEGFDSNTFESKYTIQKAK
jgi:hypothetical protein